MPRAPKLLAALAAMSILGAACASGGSDDSSGTTDAPERSDGSTTDPAFAPGDCPESDYFDADDFDGECGTVTVPENYDEPDGAQVELAVMIIPAADDDPEPDPVLYLDGGPGGDGMSNAALFAETPWHEKRDIILYSQRGTGWSEPTLNCDAGDAALEDFLDLEPDGDEAEELSDELFLECRDDLLDQGIDLQQYSSANSAKDIAVLREVLGEERGFDEWNLLGISYGTRLALTVMRDEPDGLRSVTIDGVYPLSGNLAIEVGPNAQAAFDTFFEVCADDPVCDREYPDLAERWETLVDDLEEDPVTIDAQAIVSDLGGEVLIDGDTLVGGLFQLLYISEIIPQLPSMIEDMEDGDFGYFAAVLLELAAGNAEGISEGFYYSVQCQEEVPFGDEEEALRALEGLDPVVARSFDGSGDFEDCKTWGVVPSDEIENEPVSSDVPTLVMSGGFDPVTPVRWAELAAETLSNHWFVVVQSSGHGASLDDCGMEVVDVFLDDPTEDPTLPCAEEDADIRWR